MIKTYLDNNRFRIIGGLAIILAIIYTDYFLLLSRVSLGVADGLSRLNIARRVVDNLTPGLVQLGGVWLPLPQVFFIPLAQIDFLYHTALVGAIVNGLIFVIGAFFVCKLVELITDDKRAGWISGLAYVTASNLLFFQTTAMSEPSIIVLIIISTYFLLKWAKFSRVQDLFLAAIGLIFVSLTRYEGFAVLGLAILVVFLVTYLKKSKIRSTEGVVILFTTLASFGFVLWSLYLWLIFKDPLYWMHVYLGDLPLVSTEALNTARNLTMPVVNMSVMDRFINSVVILFNSVLGMVGLIVFPLGVIGLVFGLWEFARKRQIEMLPLLLFLGPLIFLFINLFQTPSMMRTPIFHLSSIFDPTFGFHSDLNSRYGLQALPIFVVFIGVLAHKMKRYSLVLALLIGLQFGSVFSGFNLIFALQKQPQIIEFPAATWMNSHYTGGHILASVLSNDSMMFHLNIPQREFIFEGNGNYWLESLNDPTKYASWVIMKDVSKETNVGSFVDLVTRHLAGSTALTENYDLVYRGDMLIYKIKDRPRIELN